MGLLLTATALGSITDLYRSEMADTLSEADAAEHEMASEEDDFSPVLQRFREALYLENNTPITNQTAQAEKMAADPIDKPRGKRLRREKN